MSCCGCGLLKKSLYRLCGSDRVEEVRRSGADGRAGVGVGSGGTGAKLKINK
jgi:hypothetical protein